MTWCHQGIRHWLCQFGPGSMSATDLGIGICTKSLNIVFFFLIHFLSPTISTNWCCHTPVYLSLCLSIVRPSLSHAVWCQNSIGSLISPVHISVRISTWIKPVFWKSLLNLVHLLQVKFPMTHSNRVCILIFKLFVTTQRHYQKECWIIINVVQQYSRAILQDILQL